MEATGTATQYDVQKLERSCDPMPRSPPKIRTNNFIPDYGRITAYRGATGMGIRLDGGTAYSGAVITRYYDSLLEKVTAWAPTPEAAIARMDRALREFRIRGVSTNIAFVENLLKHPTFLKNEYHTKFIDETPELFHFKAAPRPGDEASDLYRRHYDQRTPRNGWIARSRPRFDVVRTQAQACPAAQITPDDGTQAKSLTKRGPKALADWMQRTEAAC